MQHPTCAAEICDLRWQMVGIEFWEEKCSLDGVFNGIQHLLAHERTICSYMFMYSGGWEGHFSRGLGCPQVIDCTVHAWGSHSCVFTLKGGTWSDQH